MKFMDRQQQVRMDIIREAFLYQSRFDRATMVFKIDFDITEDRGFPYLMKDIAMLAKMGIRIVIVPGSTEYIDRVLLEHKIVSKYNGKDRITTEDAIPLVEMAAFHVATRYITALSASRVDAVIGNFVRARGRGVVNGIDMDHTGTVDKIFSTGLKRIVELGMVPVLPCIGWSPVGRPYNVPSDEIAISAACALGATKLFIVSRGNPLQKKSIVVPQNIEQTKEGRIIRINLHECENLLELNSEIRSTGESKKCMSILNLALSASRLGVERVHIIDGCEEGAVLRELYSNLGSGTMLYADEYESIRVIRNSDIPDMLHIMEPLVEQDILVRRSAEDVQKKKDDYVVFVIDGSVHACAALHDWGEGQGEIAALAAEKAYSDMGLGRRLVYFLIEKARKQGLTRVFVLTTKTQDWFELLGFREAEVSSLPAQRRENYNKQRMSKVFALDL
jgi:amino-acid N-acetyltransferase